MKRSTFLKRIGIGLGILPAIPEIVEAASEVKLSNCKANNIKIIFDRPGKKGDMWLNTKENQLYICEGKTPLGNYIWASFKKH